MLVLVVNLKLAQQQWRRFWLPFHWMIPHSVCLEILAMLGYQILTSADNTELLQLPTS
jgi:hypothetical protein